MVATKRLRLALETDKERTARLEKMVATTHLRLSLETEEERRANNGLNLIWIEIGVLKNTRNELAHPVMGTNHFSSVAMYSGFKLVINQITWLVFYF